MPDLKRPARRPAIRSRTGRTIPGMTKSALPKRAVKPAMPKRGTTARKPATRR